jgi:cytochrome c556
MYRAVISAVAALLVSLSLTPLAGAAATPENAIKYRHAVMDAMKGHVAAIALLAFNQVPDEGEFLEDHAEALAGLGNELQFVFPEGSGTGKTHALPAIWEQPDKFAESVQAAVEASAALEKAAGSGDRKAIAGAFKQLGESCKGCHESFREEEDDH